MWIHCGGKFVTMLKGGSRTAATSKIEHFVITVNGWNPLTVTTKLHLGCCSSPTSTSDVHSLHFCIFFLW